MSGVGLFQPVIGTPGLASTDTGSGKVVGVIGAGAGAASAGGASSGSSQASQAKPHVTVTAPQPHGATGGSQGAMGGSFLGPGLLPLTSVPSKVSSSEAAANWLRSAQTETPAGGSSAVQKAAVRYWYN